MGGSDITCAIHQVGHRDAVLSAAVRADLVARGVVLDGLILDGKPAAHAGHVTDRTRLTRLCVCDVPDHSLLDVVTALSGEVQCGGGRVLVVVGAGGYADRLVWPLLSRGASDVLCWSSTDDPGAAVLARLRRWNEVDAVVDSPLVRRQLIGRSSTWTAALRRVVEVARFTGAALLVTGESGTGKELVARLFHHLDQRTGKRDLVVVDCATIVPTLSGSEFFGHERGAFTGAMTTRDGAFAAADKGTLFLDEVGELPIGLQPELLRVVQEGSYKRVGGDTWRSTDFRLVCATNRNLRSEVEVGHFRLDLYHRLAANIVALPPLRERRGDIMPLFRHFLAEATGAADLQLDPSVVALIEQRDYPGNVRDLRQLALRIAARLVEPGPVTPGVVPDEERPADGTFAGERRIGDLLEDAVEAALQAGRSYRDIRDAAADAAVRLAIRLAGNDLQEAARRLGVTDRMVQKWRANSGVPAAG
ncbi:MAG: sigma 54-interacting transcriptional regulator [Pseudonocardiaceae bacterium]